MPASENAPEGPGAEPQAALAELARVQQQMRARRWWYVATAVIMAISLTAFYTGILIAPHVVDAWILPGAVIVIALLFLLQWRARSLPAPAKALETRVVWISMGLVLVLVLARMLLGENFSPWFGVLGVLPAVPWAVVAWQVGRR